MSINVYTGSLNYQNAEYQFVFHDDELHLIPPPEVAENILWGYERKEIAPGVYTSGDPLRMKESVLVGRCRENNKYIAVRHIDRQRYSTLSLGLLNSPNLAAGITGVKLVEPVLNARKIVVYAVRVNGVVVVVNGNVANAILGKSEVCVQTCQGRIASQSGQILRDNDSYTPRFNLDQHTLKAGAVVVRAGISIVHKEHRVRKVILLSVFQKNSLLRRDLSRVFSS